LLFVSTEVAIAVALPKPYRLRRREDFDQVYQTGLRRRATHLHLVAVRNLTAIPSVSPLALNAATLEQLTPLEPLTPKPAALLPGDPEQKPCQQSCQDQVCFGISISKKVSKLAVVRNRIKRQIRAALRQLLPRAQPGWSVIIVVRSTVLTCDYWQILQELEQLLVKGGIIRGD
jgi:ribonuclease P protein component